MKPGPELHLHSTACCPPGPFLAITRPVRNARDAGLPQRPERIALLPDGVICWSRVNAWARGELMTMMPLIDALKPARSPPPASTCSTAEPTNVQPRPILKLPNVFITPPYRAVAP